MAVQPTFQRLAVLCCAVTVNAKLLMALTTTAIILIQAEFLFTYFLPYISFEKYSFYQFRVELVIFSLNF